MVFARVGHEKFEQLTDDKQLQFLWQPKFATKDSTRLYDRHRGDQGILAHVLYDHYNPPKQIRLDDWQ